jgi:hypothetical protein
VSEKGQVKNQCCVVRISFSHSPSHLRLKTSRRICVNSSLAQHCDNFSASRSVLDYWRDPANGPKLQKDISGSTLIVIPSADHVPHEEQPGAFNQHAIDFVKSLSSN